MTPVTSCVFVCMCVIVVVCVNASVCVGGGALVVICRNDICRIDLKPLFSHVSFFLVH